jgi:hypothetical protein
MVTSEGFQRLDSTPSASITLDSLHQGHGSLGSGLTGEEALTSAMLDHLLSAECTWTSLNLLNILLQQVVNSLGSTCFSF